MLGMQLPWEKLWGRGKLVEEVTVMLGFRGRDVGIFAGFPTKLQGQMLRVK